ncbi:ParA family protein [Halobaculum sp. MBLA0147]|uniref:ParA family protein n=1 Tax=Halobaculum sp. MBLA0147 TaxID=3079934 RepID=UPI003525D106
MPPDGPEATEARLVVANAKGGVGKTTVAANLVGALSQRGLDVLAVDADPQGNLTEALGHLDAYEAEPPTLFDILLDPREQSHLEEIVVTGTEADLVPASIDMLGAEMELAAAHMYGQWQATDLDGTALATARRALDRVTNVATPETPGAYEHGFGLLATALDGLEHDYDVTVIDAPPGHNLTFKNALFAAPNLVVPATAEASSKGAVDRLFDEIAAFEEDTGRMVRDVAAVVNRIRMSTNAADEMTQFLTAVFDDIPVYQVPERVALSYAYDAGESIFEYEPSADVAPTFAELADTVVETLEVADD